MSLIRYIGEVTYMYFRYTYLLFNLKKIILGILEYSKLFSHFFFISYTSRLNCFRDILGLKFNGREN